MKKMLNGKCFRAMAAVLLAVLLAAGTVPDAAAAAQTAHLFALEDNANMSVAVRWDTEEPEISFIGPDGSTYSEGSGITVQRGGNITYYMIPNASAGEWQIVYDKLGNTELDVSWAQYYTALTIGGLTLADVSGDTAEVEFAVSYDDADAVYDYIIYAVVTGSDGSVTGQKALASSTARVGETITVRASLSELSSYDGYRIMVEAYLVDGGVEINDSAITDESFNYSNSRQPPAPDGFYVEFDLSSDTLTVDWSGHAVSNSGYIIAVYSPIGSDEPIFAAEYEPDINASSILADSQAGSFKIELAYRKDGLVSSAAVKEFKMDTGTTIAIITDEVTNSAQTVIEYNTSAAVTAAVSVNGETETVNLSGSGYFSVDIGGFGNDISVSYYPYDDVRFVIRDSVYADRIAPVLRLYENNTVITTSVSSYLLVGGTEADCILTVNGTQVDLNEDGTFIYELALSDGENNFDVLATDTAGNSSLQTVTIIRSALPAGDGGEADGSFISRWLPLLATLAASIAVCAFIFLLSRRYKKNSADGRARGVMRLLRDILLTISLISLAALIFALVKWRLAAAVIDTADFFELVQNSSQEAFAAIANYSFYKDLFFSLCWVTGISVLMTALLIAILVLMKKNQDKAQTRQDETTEEAIPNVQEHASEPFFCPYCGTRHEQRVKFCGNCGEKLSD